MAPLFFALENRFRNSEKCINVTQFYPIKTDSYRKIKKGPIGFLDSAIVLTRPNSPQNLNRLKPIQRAVFLVQYPAH
jgi:hypothetical protein